ncbi:RNA-binding protein [Variovorax rhizosphaerae]|uniref:RNA-binding protein n=1 Tax=Variovorax rhizosphaerae TaxID=1836200 RepID=A0ABU8WTJ2_9BURK
MARLWLGNIESGISDEEIGKFLSKYGFPAFSDLQHVTDDGPRPAVVVNFPNVDAEALRGLKERIHDMYWRKGRIVAQVLKDDYV